MINIKISQNAIEYIANIIKKDEYKNLNLYLSILYQKTKYAQANLTFCLLEDVNNNDKQIKFQQFTLYIDHRSEKSLKNALIDIKNEQLKIYVPNINIYKQNISIEEQIKNLITNDINVILSQHGGFIELINIKNEDTITIKFHGGCQGCGMVDYTLNNYIEKIIKKNFPHIKNIEDITSHDIKKNAYY